MADLNQTTQNSSNISINGSSGGGSSCNMKVSQADSDGKIAGYSLILIISLLGNVLVILVVSGSYAYADLSCGLRTLDSGFTGKRCSLFVGVVFPLRAGLISSKVRITMIAITWVISLGFTTTSFYAMKVVIGRDGNPYCTMRWHDDTEKHMIALKTYSTILSVVFFVTPLILLVLFYSVILITLGKRKFPRVNQSQEAKKRNRRVSRSATVIAFTIVMVFWICWCPYNTIMFLWAFKWDWNFPTFCGFRTIFYICQFLTWANAAVNPCIYFILIENYRKGLRTVLPRTLSASLNSSLKMAGRSAARNDTQVNDEGDCLELVDQ